LAGALFLLALGWWVLHAQWGAGFRALGSSLLEVTGAGRSVQLTPAPPVRGSLRTADTVVQILDGSARGGVKFEVSSLRYSYIPLAVFLALWLATSGSGRWSLGRRGLFAGLVAIAAYVVFALAVTVARIALREPSLGLSAPAPVSIALELAYRVLVNPPGFEYVVPAFLWLLCAARWGGEASQRSR
jgi:hypothetical protein